MFSTGDANQFESYTKLDAWRILMRETKRSPRRMDVELVVECLEYLYPDEMDAQTLQTHWERFQRKLKIREREALPVRKRKPVALVAAMILLGVMLLAAAISYAFGFDVWAYLIRWNESVFSIQLTPASSEIDATELPIVTASLSEQSSAPSDYTVWGDAIEEALNDNGLTPALPTWLPEGFHVVDVAVHQIDELQIICNALYLDAQNRSIVLYIEFLNASSIDSSLEVEKDERLIRVYTISGVNYYILENLDRHILTWVNAPYYINIGGDLTQAELEQMIDSMK